MENIRDDILHPKLVSPESIAALFAIDREFVYRCMADDKVPYINPGEDTFLLPQQGAINAISDQFELDELYKATDS